MSSGSSINQNIWVDRPVHEVFARWTDPAAVPRFAPGVSHVEADGATRTVCKTRCLGLPGTMVVDVVEVAPPSRVAFTTQDGRLEGQVTFVGLNATTTAVTVNATYRAQNPAERLLATIGSGLSFGLPGILTLFGAAQEAAIVASFRILTSPLTLLISTVDLLDKSKGIRTLDAGGSSALNEIRKKNKSALAIFSLPFVLLVLLFPNFIIFVSFGDAMADYPIELQIMIIYTFILICKYNDENFLTVREKFGVLVFGKLLGLLIFALFFYPLLMFFSSKGPPLALLIGASVEGAAFLSYILFAQKKDRS